MATLKYRDSNGNFIAIPSVAGPAGVGIQNIIQTTSSNDSGGNNVWTATMTDGTTATFTVKNGAQGAQGPAGPAGGIRDVAASATKGYITVTNADNTTKEVAVGDANALLKTGGTMTGALIINNDNSLGQISLFEDGEGGTLTIKSKSGTYQYHIDAYDDETIRIHTADLNPNGYYKQMSWNGKTGALTTDLVYGAVWNDYAEYREANTTESGRAVYEVGDDTLALANKRMMPACSIISDTFGFAIGKTEKCQTPLAQAGRVLAYPYEDRNSYKPGDAVCSGPNGTVSKMTQEEKVNHPECIIGYVSCVPEYDTWGEHDTKVDGRIWIKVV